MMRIESQSGAYVVEEKALFSDALAEYANRERLFVIMDSHFAKLTNPNDLKLLEKHPLILVEASEPRKSFDAISPLLTQLLEKGFRRNCELLAIGGGIIQDITCFMASVLMRGVKWSFIPTTLLAQCDSCIGSKSSINIGHYKNQIGTFFSPKEITLVSDVLQTLPADDLRSGLGEAIKLHLLAGESKFRWLQNVLGEPPLTPSALQAVVQSCLGIKKPFIEADEFDQGIRNLLNYGHTFGHAYESATDFQIPHGIAVTLGIATATFVSEQLQLTPSGHYQEIAAFLQPWHHPYGDLLQKTRLEKITAAMKLDKKNTSGGITCILTRGFGQMEKTTVNSEILTPIIDTFLRNEL